MRTFYVVHNKQAGTVFLAAETPHHYLSRVGCIRTDSRETKIKENGKTNVGDKLYFPEEDAMFEVIVLK